jgi:hypothetical protein
MPAPDIFVQVTATLMDSNSGQLMANPKTVMVQVPGPGIDMRQERHREQAADASGGQLAEYLATDAALQLLAKLGYPGIGRILTPSRCPSVRRGLPRGHRTSPTGA